MPSKVYDSLLSLTEGFLGRAKAETALASQLVRCGATPESLTANHVSKVINYICGATKIHLAGDRAKQAELDAQLRAFEREGRSAPAGSSPGEAHAK